MNKFNFNNTGGFPFELDSLDEMYQAFNLLNCIGEVSGDKTILKGCTLTGSNVSDGVVYLNGEMLEFRGGNKLTSVKIFEEAIKKDFENGEQKEVFFHRWVGFGSGAGSMPWADFKLVISLRELQGRLLPPGTNPQMYTGSITEIPDGWQLCDGTNNTPPLEGMFIVGYDPNDVDYNAIGKTGGEKKHSLTENELASHDHDMLNTVYSNEAGGVNAGDKLSHDGNIYAREVTKTKAAGSGYAHENRPPYFTLAYIIYTGN